MATPGETPLVWSLIATALALLTIPGIALFYGGMVRRKNVVNTIGAPFLALALASVLGMIASAAVPAMTPEEHIRLLRGILGGALALALITGAVAERLSWTFYAVFGVLWLGLIYGPLGHATWSGGWIGNLGALDFGGGGVIHLSAGCSALVAAVLVGPRAGHGRVEMMPGSLPLSLCGAGLLWIGWSGLAFGAAPISATIATTAFVAIQCSAAAAALVWTVAEWLQRDKPTVLGTVSGAVAGLIGISAGAGYVGPLAALVIGAGAGGACYMAVNFVKPILRYDDSLDVFGMHAVAGLWSLIATGLFASAELNPSGSDGLFFGYPYQLVAQVSAALAIAAVATVGTAVIVKALNLALAHRVPHDAELLGLDLSQHGERGYS